MKKICKSKRIKFACPKRIKEHLEIILRIKGVFPMFFVISNRTVENPQNLNKNVIKRKEMNVLLLSLNNAFAPQV